MLEVQIPDMLRRPMGQLAPANVCDLVALAEYDDCPRTLKEGLDKFVERTAKEVTDIPPGTLFEGFLDELAEIEADSPGKVFTVLQPSMGRGGARGVYIWRAYGQG